MNVEVLSIRCSFDDLDNTEIEELICDVKIRTCSCYFDRYILWLNSTDVRKIVSRH